MIFHSHRPLSSLSDASTLASPRLEASPIDSASSEVDDASLLDSDTRSSRSGNVTPTADKASTTSFIFGFLRRNHAVPAESGDDDEQDGDEDEDRRTLRAVDGTISPVADVGGGQVDSVESPQEKGKDRKPDLLNGTRTSNAAS